jgi:hypothetical protein
VSNNYVSLEEDVIVETEKIQQLPKNGTLKTSFAKYQNFFVQAKKRICLENTSDEEYESDN